MFRISVIDSPKQRLLVLEGNLIAPWANEVRLACEMAQMDLAGREFVIEMKDVISISQAGENVLAEAMQQGIKVRCCGMFPKLVLKQLARRARNRPEGQW